MDMRKACYKCIYRGELENSTYSYCKNRDAMVESDRYGRINNWFNWPYSFDPLWLLKCSGFKKKSDVK